MADVTGKKGIGIIGYGGFGDFIHKAWNQMDNAHVVAICDRDPSRNPGGDVTFYTEDMDIMNDDNVDIVSIATPPSTHKDLAIMGMRAGKHVLIEKPLALTEKDGLLIKKVSEETAKIATVNFILRFNPIVEKLREIVKAEVFGKLRRMDLRNYAMQETVPEGHWFWQPEIGGGIMLEHGVHFFDLASWMVEAKAADVVSLSVDRKPGMEDRVFAAVKYENGVVGTFWHSFSRPRPLETTIFHFAFDLGEIEMIGWIPLELQLWGWTGMHGAEKLSSLAGASDLEINKLGQQKVKSSEYDYEVEYEVNGSIELEKVKLAVYADDIRDLMADMIKKIDNPSYQMRVTLDDALEAVRIAEKATKFSHARL